MSVPTILVVDDDGTTCRQLRHVFESAEWEYRQARYVSDALRMLDDPPDGVVVNMGLANAELVLGAIRARDLATFVVALIGDDDGGRLEALGERFRADSVRSGPVDVQEVFNDCESARRKATLAIHLFVPTPGKLARCRKARPRSHVSRSEARPASGASPRVVNATDRLTRIPDSHVPATPLGTGRGLERADP
jgi:DNA-binding response OmpR family regulator